MSPKTKAAIYGCGACPARLKPSVTAMTASTNHHSFKMSMVASNRPVDGENSRLSLSKLMVIAPRLRNHALSQEHAHDAEQRRDRANAERGENGPEELKAVVQVDVSDNPSGNTHDY